MNKYFIKAFKGKNNFWRYLIVILVVFIATQIGSLPLGIVVASKAIVNGIEMNASNLTNFKLLGINQNLGLMLITLPFVAGLIAFVLMFKTFHKRSILDSLTGRKKFDWNRFLFAGGVWGILMIISVFVSYFMNPDNYTIQFNVVQFLILVIISVVFISIQSAFEEVIFRGYLQQGIAVLTRTVWIPLIITSVAFGMLHYSNPEVKEFGAAIMLPQYILLGFVFGVCVIMDEGLEIAIGVHVVNNVLSALLYTHESSVLQTPAIFKADKIDPVYSLFELIIFSSVFMFIITKKYKWRPVKKLFERVKPEQF